MVARASYIPTRGDVISIMLDPQSDHEQAGRRPAVILSPAAYNAKVGLALLCPVTGQVKGHPFQVAIPAGLPISGVIVADQIKSLDWQERQMELSCSWPPGIVSEALQKIGALLAE